MHFHIMKYCNLAHFAFPQITDVGNLNIIMVFAMRRLSSSIGNTVCEIICTLSAHTQHIDDKLICKCFLRLDFYIYTNMRKSVCTWYDKVERNYNKLCIIPRFQKKLYGEYGYTKQRKYKF